MPVVFLPELFQRLCTEIGTVGIEHLQHHRAQDRLRHLLLVCLELGGLLADQLELGGRHRANEGLPARISGRGLNRLQPEEGIRLHIMAKEPGAGEVMLKPVPMSLSFGETFGTRVPEAYERLLGDVLAGNPTLFMRRDEVEAAWRWIDPILAAWDASCELPEPYAAGTSGPSGAHELLGRSGRSWHEEES